MDQVPLLLPPPELNGVENFSLQLLELARTRILEIIASEALAEPHPDKANHLWEVAEVIRALRLQEEVSDDSVRVPQSRSA